MSTSAPTSPTPSTKRLSKAPIILFVAFLAVLSIVVFYSLSQQGQQQQQESKDKKLTQATENISASSMQDILRQKNRKINQKDTESFSITTSSAPNLIAPETSPQQQQLDFNNRPQKFETIPQQQLTNLPVDQRFSEYEKLRAENFKRALSSSSKKIDAKSTSSNGVSTQLAPPPQDASYEEKMQFYRQQQARLDTLKNNPSEQYQAKLAFAKQMLGQYQQEQQGNPQVSSSNSVNQESKDWKLNAALEKAQSLTINTGFVIPAVMITGINSDIAGSIIAQVSQNVYDTATGSYLLIPQGTKLFGTYSSKIEYGQERVLVAWNRLIYPDGRTLDLGQMLGADVGGYSGFSDQVNNHYWKLFKGAFLLSMITAAVTYSDNKYNNNSDSESRSATSAMSESLGQNLGDVSVELIRKNMNISPTLEIRNGYRFNVVVTKDIQFSKPYRFQN